MRNAWQSRILCINFFFSLKLMSLTVLLCLPLLATVGHLRDGLLHLFHGSGAAVRHTGDGGDGSHPQPW